jgi:serine protease
MFRALLTMTGAAALLIASPFSSASAQEKDESDGNRVVVAVLDTGITSHSALGWQVRKDGSRDGTGVPGGVTLSGYDFVSDPWTAADGDGWDSDPTDRGDGVKPRDLSERPDCQVRASTWHGTNVAGTIAAQQSKRPTVLGLAPEARILPVRIMGRCGGNTADVAAGLLWAVGESVPGIPDNPNPARIVNVSLSGTSDTCPRALQTAIDIANERGALVVVASGSAGRNTSSATPANCAGVIVVGATDRNGERSPTSNYGTEVTLSALGGDMSTGERDGVFTTTNSGTYRPHKQEYGYYQGSSAAAARVSAALALLATRFPDAGSEQLTGLLMSSLDLFAQNQCDEGDGMCGRGIMNLSRVRSAA